MTYTIRTPKNYPEGQGCYEVVWGDFFMPFNIICGLDTCPPDNGDYTKNEKTFWWVCPATKKDFYSVHDISYFIWGLEVKAFETVEQAVEYCLEWRKNWLKRELEKQM